MTMQSDHQNKSFIDTAGGQTLLMLAGLLIMAALAWIFVF